MSAPRMSRIEMVMHLQSVDLFRSCAATDIVRLAQIAVPVEFGSGEVVYRPTEASLRLYTVVEGRVSIEGVMGRRRVAGPHSSFGILEILSGRQRRSRAEATERTLALAIEAEDFFDLLSNNIDIVKALFREVVEERSDRALPSAAGAEAAPAKPATDRSVAVASSVDAGAGVEGEMAAAKRD